MTYRQAFQFCLIELNKVQAPSLLLEDFVYLFNKAIQQYFNKRYNLFELKQQLTDDLRVLTKTIRLTPVLRTGEKKNNVFGDSYEVELPPDYVHILNCICEFQDLDPNKCNEDNPVFQYGANKLDTNQWSSVITNYYMRPSVKQPYYYIINIDDPESLRADGTYDSSGNRYGNTVKPKLEIKCGKLGKKYALNNVYIDYLRAPKHIELDEYDLDSIQDNTPHLEFPDYVVYEIINGIVNIILENTQNPRIQTFPAMNESIPSAQK